MTDHAQKIPESPLVAPWCDTYFELQERSMNGLSGSALHGLRVKAFEAYKNLGFPQANLMEDWKYTSLKEVVRTDFQMDVEPELHDEVLDAFTSFPGFEDYYNFCSLNGHMMKFTQDALPEGVVLKTLNEMAHSDDPADRTLLEQHIGSICPADKNGLIALNTSLYKDGLFLFIKKNVVLERPIRIFHAAEGKAHPIVSFPRVVAVLEQGSSATLLQQYRSFGASVTFLCSVTECVVAENARFENILLQEEGLDRFHYNHTAVEQGRTSSFKNSTYSFGGKIVRNEIAPVLSGSGSDTQMYGLSVLGEEQHVDNFTVLDHAVPSCESNELYKGIYDQKSKGVFCGTIIVREDAQKTNAIQSNQGLLLSDKASLSTKPQLKIWADDVKCTHGATVGQIDKDALFYLRSRGLPRREAMSMLVKAFAGDVTREIQQEKLRSYIEDTLLDAKLAAGKSAA